MRKLTLQTLGMLPWMHSIIQPTILTTKVGVASYNTHIGWNKNAQFDRLPQC